ncbi:MAG: YbbR-like domain-containing protein [Clostridia bacterium]|nr:YbbR-like domain-containing protein [Clostridia bacterium]
MPKWLKIKSLPLLIVSVLASVIIWLVVMNLINPTMDIRFSDVDVTILGTTELYQNNGFSILSETELSVDVELSGGRNSILRLKRDDIEVYCDVSRISRNGTNRVQCTVTTPYDDVTVTNLRSIVANIEVDKISEEPVKLIYDIKGELPENYMLGEITLPNAEVLVSGPKSEISSIAYGLITADISELRNSQTLNLPIALIGKSGEQVELKYTQQITKNADINIPVLLKKEVPFTYSISGAGGLTRDDVDVTISPKSVTLIGDPQALADTEYISLGVITLDNIGEGASFDVAFFVPVGATCSSDRSTVTVDVRVKDIETRTFKVSPILATGSVEGFDAKVSSQYINVRLRGNKNLLDSIGTDDFIVTVSLDQVPAQAGHHTATPEVNFIPSLYVELLPSDYAVTVTLTPTPVEPVDVEDENKNVDPS